MDTRSEFNEANKKETKKSLFDPSEIKGISLKSAKTFFSGKIARAFRSVSKFFSFTSSRVYGLAFLSFGILTLFLHLGEYYFMDDPQVEVSSLVIGAVFTLVSLLFLPSDKPICSAIQSVRLFDFIVYDFFSINRVQQRGEKSKTNSAEGILFGFLLALFGFFFPTEYAVLLILGLVFVIISMVSPEFPYILSLLLFPYLPLLPYSSYILVIFVAGALVSFARKVFVGKRVYNFEIYDFLFLFLILSVFVTGVILGGEASTENSILTIVFLIGYFPASNMAINRRLFDCVAGAISASSIPVGIYAAVQYIVSLASGSAVKSKAFFDTPEIFAAYLSAVAIFSLYLARKRTRRVKKAYYYSVFALSFIALLTTELFIVLITIILAVVSLSIIRSKKVPIFLLILVEALPVLLFLLNDSADAFVSDIFSLSLADRKSVAAGAFSFFLDNPILGMGVENPFSALDFSSNLYLAIVCRFGVLALIVFLLLIVLRACHFGLFRKYFSDSTVNFYAEISILASVCMLLIGSLSDVFADIRMIYFFTAVFSVGSSALRISKKEKEEMRLYYSDLGNSDLAEIDISIKK